MRLIDADKLVNSLENNLQSFEEMISELSEHGKGLVHGTRTAINRIAEQPTISPESLRPQWIPVTERLPEDCDERFYMCVVENHESDPPMYLQYSENTGFGLWSNVFDEHTLGFVGSDFSTNEELGYEKVLAWMPLPEPYTADAEENEGVQPAHWEKADIPLPYQMRTVPTPSGTFAHREMYVCSACDGYNDKNTQYCPHCGARMDRKDGNG